LKHKKYPFALSLSKCRRNWRQGFDKLSPNGVGVVFEVLVFPIILSLSKDRLSPNGVGVVFEVVVFPIILSPSKSRLRPNGVGAIPIWAGTLDALIV
jgi:hypothetical protein